MEYFDADDLVGFVVVEDDAGGGFCGFEDGGDVETAAEGVGLFIDLEFHGCQVVHAAGGIDDFKADDGVLYGAS